METRDGGSFGLRGPDGLPQLLRRGRSGAPHRLLRGQGISGGASLGADRRSDALLKGGSQSSRVLEEAVDRGIPGEALNEGAAGGRVLLAGLEERLQHLEVRDQVDERVPGEVLAGALVSELALVA